MQGRLLTDRYGRHFKSDEVITQGFYIPGLGNKNLADFSDEKIGKQTVFIKETKQVYSYFYLREIFKNNHCVRLPDPTTGKDLIEKLPDFKEVVTEFEKNAVNYNVSVLKKYPHFVVILNKYVGIVLDAADTHSPDDMRVNKRLKEFNPLLDTFSQEEKEAFNSLLITNRKEYRNGSLIYPPTLWERTEENAELYDRLVADPNGYKPYPQRNVILADAFAAAYMSSWGMDVLHLLLQYQHVTKSEVPVFDQDENPFAYKMEETLRTRIKKEALPPLEIEKGVQAQQLARKLADPVPFLIQDIIDKQKLFEGDTWFDTDIWNRINFAKESLTKESSNFMDELASSFKGYDGNDLANRLLCNAIIQYRRHLKNWPTLSSWYELLLAEQKQMFIDRINLWLDDNDFKEYPYPFFIDTMKDLRVQVRESDTATSLSDILKKGSSYLAVKWYDQPKLKQWLEDEEMEVWLDKSRQFIDLFHPCPHTDANDLEEQLALREKSLAFHADLIKDRQDYIKHGYGAHARCVTSLIDQTTNKIKDGKNIGELFHKKKDLTTGYKASEKHWEILNTSVIEHLGALQRSYKKLRHREDICALIEKVQQAQTYGQGQRFLFVDIMKTIQDAYDFEAQHYNDNLFSMFRPSFEDRIARNDNDFCYPRGLKAILNKFNPELALCKSYIDEQAVLPVKQNIDR